MLSKVKRIIEYLVVFILLLGLSLYINRSIQIKALYMDDLYSWSWFPGLNLFEYAFKFWGSTRYRPAYDTLQYIEYFFVQNRVYLFATINKVLNALVALFVYHFAIRLNAKRIIAFIVASMYLVSHFSYYQIGQVLGLLETEAQFFALLILFLCLKLVGVIERKDNSKGNNIITFFILLMYLIIAFTHERYLSLLLVIVISIFFAKELDDKKSIYKYRTFAYISLALVLIFICVIRYFAIGVVLPAGTGGTRVESTFKLQECLSFCVNQVLMVFGVNKGPDYLVGIEFTNISNIIIKYLTLVSSCLLISTSAICIIYKIIRTIKFPDKGSLRLFLPDILFFTFIAMCIGSSSVTIRVEMRFVYASFTASLLYISYIAGFFFKEFSNRNKAVVYILINLAVIIMLGLRVPIELTYRDYYKNIHFFFDLDRVNSIYDNTIGKYGVDEILRNRKVYMSNNFFGFTDYYAEWFFKIYDTRNLPIEEKGNKIQLIKNVMELPLEATKDNSVLLIENVETNRDYFELPIER